MLYTGQKLANISTTIDGYTPTIASIATKPVTYGTDTESVDITYTPNAQTTNIIYKDEDGQTIKTDKVDGKTNETVKVDSTIPVGWKLVDGQDVPETVKFGQMDIQIFLL